MNDIKHEAYVLNVYVKDNDVHKNIIEKVIWTIIFTRGKFSSIASGESEIKYNRLNDFIDIDDVDQETVLDWAFSSHGSASKDQFISYLKDLHTPEIEKQEREDNLRVWNKPLKNQTLNHETFLTASIDQDILDLLK
jgi:hypothetical protein